MGVEVLNLMIVALLFSAVIIGCGLWIADVSEAYGTTIANHSSLSVASDMKDKSDAITEALNNTQSSNWIDNGIAYVSVGLNAVMLMLTVPALLSNIIMGVGTMIPAVPPFITGIMVTIVTLIVVFGIIRAIMGRNKI